jgi:hypothetical protein
VKEGEEAAAEESQLMDTRDYARALAVASLEERPADVAALFGDALRERVAEMVAAYQEAIARDGFDTAPVEEDETNDDEEDETSEEA